MRLPFVAFALVVAIFTGCQWTRLLLADKTPRATANESVRRPQPSVAAPEQAPIDDDASAQPNLLAERLEAFTQSINELYDSIVAQLGAPQPQKEWDPANAKGMSERDYRISRGFFEDMKKLNEGRALEDADPDYQRKRLSGMSDRIDQQFHDVAGALRDFEDAQYRRNGSKRR